MRNIVFVKTSSLGDIIHHMPAISDARRVYPDARLSWVVEEPFAPLARLHRDIDEVIPVATRRWRTQILNPGTWREVFAFTRRGASPGARTVIDTQGLIRSAIIARIIRGEVHGYDRASIREPLASWLYDATYSVKRDLHAVTRNRLLTALSLGYQPEKTIDYGLELEQKDLQSPYALLCHGTSRVDKEWAENNWIQIGRWMSSKGLTVLLPWGTAREQVRCVRLAAEIPGSRVLGLQPLDAVAHIIARASVVVGVDTGMIHLAAAYGIPLIAIFVMTDPSLTGPVGSGPITTTGGIGIQVSPEEVVSLLEQQPLI
jgi:heptosyltransferase I